MYCQLIGVGEEAELRVVKGKAATLGLVGSQQIMVGGVHLLLDVNSCVDYPPHVVYLHLLDCGSFSVHQPCAESSKCVM